MNMIEILESIKEPYNEEDLWPDDHDTHGYLITFISEDKKTLFNHLKDGKSLEFLGDLLLMMLDSGGDDFSYAIDEMVKYRIEPRYLYCYIKDMEYYNTILNRTTTSSRKAKLKKALKQYDVPFFIEVTTYLERKHAEINYEG